MTTNLSPTLGLYNIAKITAGEQEVSVSWEDGNVTTYDSLWLRDNIPENRDPRNGQRLVSIADIPAEPKIESAHAADSQLTITWKDGKTAHFDCHWLRAHDSSLSIDTGFKRLPWTADELPEFFWADHDQVASNQDLRRDWLAAIVRDGLAFLRNVPIEEETVLRVASWIGFVRETNYGKLFDVRAVAHPNNLAFTSLGLPAHTDNPYRDPVPGLQLLHCLTTSGIGGESLFVDGLAVAETMRRQHAALFDLLVHTPVRFHFEDEKTDLSTERPLIACDLHGRFEGIYYNDRSIAPLLVTPDILRRFYSAYRMLAEMLRSASFNVSILMQPGDLVVFDNTRILHGRTAFEVQNGTRHLQGCYVDKDALNSNLAVLQRKGA